MTTEIKFPDEPIRFEAKHISSLFKFCYKANSSDITIQTGEPIIAEIYGRIKKVTSRPLSNNEVSELLNSIYGPNGTAQILRGQDLDTHYEVRPNRNERYRFRVNATGCYVDGHEGIQITARSIPTDPPDLSWHDLPQDILDEIIVKDGVVYVTGATGSGKSTLLASIIKQILETPDSNRKILTYESPIEFVYDMIHKESSVISQSEIPRHLPCFAAGVRNALRRKPHLILVGESRDPETITAVLEAVLTGHPVYTTLHSNGVAETIRRLVNSFPIDERIGRTIDIIETVRLIIWQKLIPTIDGKRTAVREYLLFKEHVRDELLAADPDNITSATRTLVEKYGRSMKQDIKEKFDQKIISERIFKILMAGLE